MKRGSGTSSSAREGGQNGGRGAPGRKAQPQASLVAHALGKKWYDGETRTALRTATRLTDAQLDEALASPECAAQLERLWRVVLREASLALVISIVARAEKESGVAKLMTELCGMGTPKPEEPASDPEADFSVFERAILDNLRAVVEKGAGDGAR